MSIPRVIFDAELIERYNRSGPRYTSYPPATVFHERFGEKQYRQHAYASNEPEPPAPLSLYLHIPFCQTVCFYCACNKIVTGNRARAIPYVDALVEEISLQSELYAPDRVVDQLHLGGGTPTFLSLDQMRRLMEAIRRDFRLRDDDSGEYSLEIDPRTVDASGIAALRDLGFNRLSLGVQDFDPCVQRAVNRIQSEGETATVIDAARAAGFYSVSVDLMYGLPHQSVDSFATTLDRVVTMRPDRIAVFNYAHLPQRFKVQRQIDERTLPAASEKLGILGHTVERLQDAGYVHIGMDHFALPGDALAHAQGDGTLHRNFQGFSCHAHCDLVAMGITAISNVGNTYAQNVRDLESYYHRIVGGRLPILRGYQLDEDDRRRARVISDLICHGILDKAEVCHDFDEYFSASLQALQAMEDDGLVSLGADRIEVLPPGRLLIRNVCMAFDAHVARTGDTFNYSRAI